MKQKVSVRAIIKHNDKTLLARRSMGRASILGKYELPGGSIDFREQPDEALRRYIHNTLSGDIETLQLYDVVGYIDPEDAGVQYIFVVYMVSLQNENALSAQGKYDKIIWKLMSDMQQIDITNSTQLLVGLAPAPALLEEEENNNEVSEVAKTTNTHFIVYSDGGSRGNPGPSASGYVVMKTSEEIVEEGGVYLGITTNNQAEYQGVLLGLQRALELGAKTVDFRADSMLIVNQMNGVYQVKNRDLWPIYERIKGLIKEFDKVSFLHVRRELNKRADAMVNKVLDEHATSDRGPNRL